jgi:hypothetical protein
VSQVLDEPVTRMSRAEALSQIRLDGRVMRVRMEKARPRNQTSPTPPMASKFGDLTLLSGGRRREPLAGRRASVAPWAFTMRR